MRASFARVDVVAVGENALVERRRVLEGNLDLDFVDRAREVNDVVVERLATTIELSYKLAQASLVAAFTNITCFYPILTS